MPLLRKTLHDLRWHIVGYGGGLGMLAALYVVLYPAFAGTFADFELPEAYSAFIGDVSDLAAPRGFFQIEFFSFWMPLLVAVYAVVVSTGLLAGDEQRGTLEMMLAQPVSRRRLFVERVAAFAIGATLICALASLGFVVSAPFIDLRGDVAVWELGLAPFAALPLALACGSLGLLAGALSPTRGLATGLVAALTHPELAHRLAHRIALGEVDRCLPQLGDDLLSCVPLPLAHSSPPSPAPAQIL